MLSVGKTPSETFTDKLTGLVIYMNFEFAPMEGVTGYIYRRTHARFFPGVPRYYAPFIAPDGQGRFKLGSLRDVLPENNKGLSLVPQILCSNAGAFLSVARELAALGYDEINLNAGCPSATVVPKHKGAGMLSDPDELDAFFQEVFSLSPVKVSVKTRLGLEDSDEFSTLMEVYRRYPLSRLIIHARPRSGFYKSVPELSAFAQAFEGGAPFPISYNGDIFCPADLLRVSKAAPGLEDMMLGRGAAANPALFRVLTGGAALEKEELREFHAALLSDMRGAGISEQHILPRMKELWFYMLHMFPGAAREGKALNKARSMPDYLSAVSVLFSSGYFDQNAVFIPPK